MDTTQDLCAQLKIPTTRDVSTIVRSFTLSDQSGVNIRSRTPDLSHSAGSDTKTGATTDQSCRILVIMDSEGFMQIWWGFPERHS